MLFATLVGFLSAIAILVVMCRIGLRKCIGYPVVMDILVTIALAWLLYGTFAGMVSAIIGGLVFSGLITIIRNTYGYSRLQRQGLKLVWVTHKGKWTQRGEEWLGSRLQSLSS